MIAFQDVLSEVRRVLQDLKPDLLVLLLTQLLEAQIFSAEYYQSLFESASGTPGDLEDLARRLALPVWQNWDTSKGIITSVEKEAQIQETEEISDVDLCKFLPDILDLDAELPDLSLADLLDLLDDKPIFTCEENPVLLKGPSRKRRAGDEAQVKAPRPKRTKKAPLSPESPFDVISSGREGDFRVVSPAAASPLFQIPLTITPASLVPPGAPAMQFIQTFEHLPTSVINSFLPAGSAYVLSLTPVPPVTLSSPADGAVAPVELSMCTPPRSSLSESASQGRSPSPLTPITPPLTPITPPLYPITPPLTPVTSSFTPVTPPPTPRTSPLNPHTPVSPDKDPSPLKELRPPSSQSVRKSPVVPKAVEDFIASYKSHLREGCSLMESGLRMESHYVDTRLVRRKLVIRTGKNANKCLEKELVVLSDSERREATLHRGHLFQNQQHLITLLGKAGTGKSTLIQRLALDWSAGGLQQFQLVFLLNCRFLNLTRPFYSLKRLLLEESACPACQDSESVFKHVLSFPEKVLVVFDSFDDVRDLEGLLQSPATSVTESCYSVRQIFSGLFQKKLLSGCTLVMATRPKDVLNQLLRKVDSILEVSCFSPEDVEVYASKYFGDPSQREGAVKKLKAQKYLFSLCSNPLLCRYACFLLEQNSSLPSTLTDLCCRILSRDLNAKPDGSEPDLMQLCKDAWEGFKTHTSLLNPNQDKDLVEYGLARGVLTSYTGTGRQERASCFANLFVQTFLSSLLLVHSSETNDKSLLARTMLHQRKRKAQGEWHDVLQRFIMGALFQKSSPLCCRAVQNTTDLQAKRKAVEVQLKNLKPAELTPSRMLELFHCVYETKNAKLAKLLVKNLPESLSFCGAQLSPADAYVVWHLLQHAKGLKRTFSVDLRDTCVPLSGLKELVSLESVRSFRAPTMDTINLWEDLHHSTDESALKRAVQKFTIDPIRVSQACHVQNLQVLVRIHREKRLPSCEVNTLEDGVPAVRDLHKLEYELRQQNRAEIFLTLTEILPDLQALQFLDLENNKIGDAGAEKLAGVLEALSSLRMLNLSQNCIGDAGVEKLAKAMASASSLQSLSLYGNLIADNGAESLAAVLPLMKTLLDLDVKYNKFTDIGAKKLSAALKSSSCIKSLQLWNECIPYGVFEHLQLQDSRIKAL